MSNCQSNHQLYSELVLSLIQFDPKYKNFNEVAKFILDNTEDTNDKLAALFNVAKLFNESSSPSLIKGISKDVIDGSTVMDKGKGNEQNYLNFIQDLLDVPITKERTVKEIATSLKELKYLTQDDVIELAKAIVREGKEDYKDFIEDFKLYLVGNPALLTNFIAHLSDTFEGTNSYVPLSTINSLSNYWVLLGSGQQLYATYDNNTKVFTEITTGKAIDKKLIIASKHSRKQDETYTRSDNGHNIWRNDTLTSDFTLVPLSDTYTITEIEVAKAKLKTNGDFTVKAIRLSNNAQERVTKIQETIPNRTLETFETEKQKAELASGKATTVVTVSRPLANKQGTMFIVEVKNVNETGKSVYFSLYSLDTYTFVDSDNTTTLVDFENPTHLKKIQELTLKQEGKQFAHLTDSDLKELKEKQKRYNDFKNEVVSILTGANAQNVTDIFNKYYNVTTKKRQELLPIDAKDENIYKLELSVVKIDNNNQPILNSEGQIEVINKKVPVVFVKTLSGDYTITNTLEDNERIYNDGTVIDLPNYIFNKKFKDGLSWYKYITEILQQNDAKSKSNTTAVIIRFDNDKEGFYPARIIGGKVNPYQILETVPLSRQNDNIVYTLIHLFETINSTNKAVAITQTLRTHMYFKPVVALGTGQTLFNVNWSKGLKNQLQIAFQPYNAESNRAEVYNKIFDKIKEDKTLTGLFNFDIDEKSINKLVETIKTSELVKDLQNENKNLPQQLETVEDFIVFSKGVSKMTSKNATKFINKSLPAIHDALIKVFSNNILTKLETSTNPLMIELRTELEKDLKGKDGKTHLEYIFLHELPFSKTKSLNLAYNPSIKKQGYNQYLVVENPESLITITPKFDTTPNTETKQAVNNTPIVENIVPKTKPVEQTPQTPKVEVETPTVEKSQPEILDIPEDDAFKLIDGTEARLISDEQFQSEIDYVKEILGSVAILPEDLGSINGNIIAGQLKDQIIYLNNTLKVGGVAYHEAFHKVFRHALTMEQRTRLIYEIQSNDKYKKSFTKESLEKFRKDRNYSDLLSINDLERLQAEEILADGFSTFVENNSKRAVQKTLLNKFFKWLEQIIKRFLQKTNEIDLLYDRMATGYYANAKNKSFNDLQTETPVAYELIQGLREAYIGETGKILTRPTTLTSSIEQEHLVNYVVATIASNSADISFDKKFDQACEHLLDTVFNLNFEMARGTNLALLQKYPELKQQIIDEYGKTYSNYRFILGARIKGESLVDFNNTGDEKYDNAILRLPVKDKEGKVIYTDNTGKEANNKLKEEVKKQYDLISSIEGLIDIVDFEKASEATENLPEEDGEDGIKSKGEDFDSNISEFNVMKQNAGMIRKFLATLPQDYVDTKLKGFKLKRMVSSETIFPLLAKITSNVAYEDIIESIKLFSELIRKDGNINDANDLMTVYDALVNSNGVIKNQQFYNLMQTVFNGVELDYMFHKVKINEGSVPNSTFLSYSLVDKLLENDMTQKRGTIYREFVNSWNNNIGKDYYKQAIDRLNKKIASIKSATSTLQSIFPLSETTNINDKLTELVDFFYNNFKEIGLDIPKSTLMLSFIAEEKKINNNIIFSEENEALYSILGNYINENNYLNLQSIYSLQNGLLAGYQKVSNLKPILFPDSGRVNEALQSFDTQLRKATALMIKVDPKSMPTVALNAENKPIYRYVRPNPISSLTLSIRNKGIIAALEEDSLWNDFFGPFVKDDPFFKDLIDGKDTPQTKKLIGFFRNFKNALYGGVQESKGDVYKEGQNYQNINKQSQYLLSLTSFMIRNNIKEIVNGENINIDTFLRQYHQQESTSTSFLIPAMYKSYYSTTETGLSYNPYKDPNTGENYNEIVKTLENKVIQEFTRGKREWNDRVRKKQLWENEIENLLYKDYNAKNIVTLDEEGYPIVTVDVEDKSLRAYKLMLFDDVINTIPELKVIQDLITSDVASYEVIDEQLKINLRKALHQYSEDVIAGEIQAFIDNDIITEVNGKYESKLIPRTLKIDGKQYYIEQLYGQSNPIKYLMRDKIFNIMENSYSINQVITGDLALNIKNKIDFVKREKSKSAAGTVLGTGWHKVSVVDTIVQFIHEKYSQFGPYNNRQEILDDINPELTEEIRTELVDTFNSQFKDGKYGPMMQKVFDGQSASLLMHVIDMLNVIGRINPKTEDLLIQKHFRTLTSNEIEYMEKQQVVLNSKKTVTSARFAYHKLSEMLIDRNEASILIDPATGSFITTDERRVEIYNELHELWKNVYANRKLINKYKTDNDSVNDIMNEIQKIVEIIHKYYIAAPGKNALHNLLNSMEYYQIDQLIDTEASKTATLLPISISSGKKNDAGYIRLDTATRLIDNSTKYLQVETSGIHNDVAYSVQRKLLVAADMYNVREIIAQEVLKSGKVLTDVEEIALNAIDRMVNDYQNSLQLSAQSRLDFFTKIFRKDKSLDMGALYKMIQENLVAQGSPETAIKLFDTDAAGNPMINANFSDIRNMLEYYLFSLYSKNITEEKTSGMKYIHESPFGRNVVIDKLTGKVVRLEEQQKNPGQYINEKGILNDRYYTRPLGITSKFNKEDGITYHTVEVMIAKPLFKSAKEEAFWLQNIAEGLGTRIPTEDKRSMVVYKVVDFLDSSKRNSFVMPYILHMLSGSDFDVDSLYAQSYAYYEDLNGNFHKYGDYSTYSSKENGKYIEYIDYMSTQKEFKNIIKDKLKQIKRSDITANIVDNNKDLQAYLTALNINIDDIKNIISDDYTNITDKNYQNLADRDANEASVEKFRNDERKHYKFIVAKYLAIVNTLNDYNVPTEIDNAYYSIVGYVHQNNNLTAAKKILSNEVIFNRLFIDQRSSIDAMESSVKKGFGVDPKSLQAQGGIFSTQFIVEAQSNNSGFKDGISKAASGNKFFALAGQYGLELIDTSVIWQFNRSNNGIDENVSYSKYGTLNNKMIYNDDGSLSIKDKYDRAIEIIGNILGMFADGAKNPLPAALGFNETNTSIALSMVGLGLPFEFAIGFNFIGKIKEAVAEMERQDYAITPTLEQTSTTLNNILRKQINDTPKYVITELINAGLLDNDTEQNLLKDNLFIDWNKVVLDVNKLKQNKLSSKEVGYSVYSKKVKELSTEAQDYILLRMYADQAQQSLALINVNYLTGLFKSFNPDMKSFNKIVSSIQDLKNQTEDKAALTLFTKESLSRLFENDQVFKPLMETVFDLDNQLDELFVERTGMFKSLAGMFSPLYTSSKEISERIMGYIAISLFKANHNKNIDSLSDNLKPYAIQDRINLLKALDPRTIYFEDIETELNKMKEQFPNNTFLQLIQVDTQLSNAILEHDTQTKEVAKLTRVIAIHKLKDGLQAGRIANDLQILLNHSDFAVRLFAKKLFYRELARTGLQSGVTGSYNKLYSDMFKSLSKPVNSFLEDIKDINPKTLIEVIMNNFNFSTNEEVYKLFDDLFIQLASGIDFKNARIPQRTMIEISATLRDDKDAKRGLVTKLQAGETEQGIRNALHGILNNQFDFNKTNALNFKNVKFDMISFNTNNMQFAGLNEKSKIPQAILNTFNIKFDKENNQYIFPPILKLADGYYMISNIDGLNTSSLGEQFIKSIINNQGFELKGKMASYIKIQPGTNTKYLKPVHLSSKNINALNNVKITPESKPSRGLSKKMWENKFSTLENAEAKPIPQQPIVVKPVETKSNLSPFTNHSGGAIGADMMFDTIGKEFGMTNNKHYWAGEKTPGGNTQLTSEQLQEGVAHAKAAAKVLGRPWNEKYANLLGRNWYQVKNSTQIIAIAPLIEPGERNSKGFISKAQRTTVDGGTGYAVEMGIANNKEVNVFDTKTNQWFKWNGTSFVKSSIPVLQKNFAGIGSRQDNGKMTKESIQAIRDVYQNTISNNQDVQVKSEISIPQNLVSGIESFGTKQEANAEAKKLLGNNPHSIDMIEAGIRTRTTRSVGEMEKYNVKVGDIVKQFGKSANGTTKQILTRITAIHPKRTPGFFDTWEKEGWTMEGVEAIKRFKDGAAAIEFEVINDGKNVQNKPVTQETKKEDIITEEIFEEYGTSYKFAIKDDKVIAGAYKQGSKGWENMNPKNYSKYYTLKNSKNNIQETKPEVSSVKKETSFTFSDGRIVKTPFELNVQQKEALQMMADFINDKTKANFTLMGYAGTGKTTLIQFLTKYINDKSPFERVLFSSPTHRANAVLRQTLKNQRVVTLHSLLGLSPEQDLEEFDVTKAKFTSQNDIKISYGDIVIIDESSMINDDLFDLITTIASSVKAKVIFMGDPAQLKPVKQEELSKAFRRLDNKYELTKVERTGDNPLLYEITHIRNTNNQEQFTFESKQNDKEEGVTYYNNYSEFLTQLADVFKSPDFKSNPLLARIVTGTNKNVKEINNIIRKGIWGVERAEQEYIVGDILMGYENFDIDYRTKEPKIINSGDYVVTSISAEKEGTWGGNAVKYYDLVIKNILNEKQALISIKMLSKNNDSSLYEAIGASFEGLRIAAMQLPKGTPEAARAWASLNSFKSQYGIPQSVTYKGRTLFKTTLDYGYAHTIHKSQGGTYKYIFIDSTDISRFPDLQMRKQLKYVAISRAQKHACIYTTSPITSAQPTESSHLFNKLNDTISSNDLEITCNN